MTVALHVLEGETIEMVVKLGFENFICKIYDLDINIWPMEFFISTMFPANLKNMQNRKINRNINNIFI